MVNYQTFSQQPSTHTRIHTHPKLAGRVRKDMHSLDLLISHTGLHYMPADQQMGNSAHRVFQVGGETVDTAGYTEQCLGQQEVNISHFPLLSKLISPSINIASIACV